MPSNNTLSPKIFECRMCGDCCKGYGGTYLTEADIVRIADFIGMAPDTFVSTHCRLSGEKPILSQKEDGYCVFWDQLCTIHPVKPRMCRQWPYIAPVLKEVENWRIMSSMCPGIHSDAPDKIIRECVCEKLQCDSSNIEK